MDLGPTDQDKIWDYYQTKGVDSFAQSRGRLEFLARRLRPGMRVLNIGVGNGSLEKIAAEKGVDIWSLDPSDGAITALRERLGMGERALVGYSQAIPFPDRSFDAVVMSEVLEHLDEDVFEKTLAEVSRVLRPTGLFLGTVPAREKLEDSMVICPNCGIHFHRWGHKRNFSVETLTIALKKYFLIDTVHELFFIEWESVGWWCRFKGLIKKFLSWRGVGTYGIGRNIYFVVRNPDLSE